jgi:Zn-dependent protease with chaperone function
MAYALHYAVIAGVTALAVVLLGRSTWPQRAPRTALVVWQAVGLAGLCSAVGLLMAAGLAPYQLGVLPGLARFGGDVLRGQAGQGLAAGHVAAVTAALLLAGWLAVAHVLCMVDMAGRRRRHRTLLRLVAHRDTAAPGALVVDHPAAAAYCLPGWSAAVVVSAGALDLLTPEQLRAVLAHERAHASERHHLVLLPFAALRRALPHSGTALRAYTAVELLIEMCADDRAACRHGARPLVDALLRFQAHGPRLTPAGALAAADTALDARVARLLRAAPPPPVAWRVLALAAAAMVLATPLSLFALPH